MRALLKVGPNFGPTLSADFTLGLQGQRSVGSGRAGAMARAGAGAAHARMCSCATCARCACVWDLWVHGAGRGASWQTSAGDEVEVGLEAGLRVAGHVPRRPRRERVEEPRAAGAAARVSRRTARKGARVQRHTVRREGEERGEGECEWGGALFPISPTTLPASHASARAAAATASCSAPGSQTRLATAPLKPRLVPSPAQQ